MIFYDDYHNSEKLKAFFSENGIKYDTKKLENFKNYVSLEDITQTEKDDKIAYALLSLAGAGVAKAKYALNVNTSYTTGNSYGVLGSTKDNTQRKAVKTYTPILSDDLSRVYELLNVCIVVDRKNKYCYYVVIPSNVSDVAASVLEEREQIQREQLEVNSSYESNLVELQRLERLQAKTNEQLLEINSLSNRAREKQLIAAALNSLLSE